ncbi:hypothetical protein [Nannocystis pusilla]|uniref:Uncharacterized protein n=1 Tax=Nannocystis pusilla TaxID=889268 RepID=A0ABS7TW66_9BACT|nr:hypothetical protein [Nannocystis pusilla]MBZ5712431.1 hypothetical protein [Nannocystis pusilla]
MTKVASDKEEKYHMSKAYIVLAALAVLGTTGDAVAAGKLKCFSGEPATCSISQNTVTLDTSEGGFAGAFITNARSLSGTLLSGVTFSFQYNCDPSDNTTDCVGGGSPRWSIPINTGGNSKAEGFAFIDAANCGSTGIVSTESDTCPVFFGSETYDNWADFASENPTYRIASELPFVITDTTEPGTTLIFDITIAKA